MKELRYFVLGSAVALVVTALPYLLLTIFSAR
jgi:hypothetical protein